MGELAVFVTCKRCTGVLGVRQYGQFIPVAGSWKDRICVSCRGQIDV